MRKIIIGVVLLLILGGGGAGAYFYFMKPVQAAEGEEGDHKKEAAKKGAHGETPATVFVEMDPLILPIIDRTGVTQTISLVIALEVADNKVAEEVTHMSPKLKDAYIQDMYGILNKHAALKNGLIQVAPIKERLNKITTDIMGEGIVQSVLLQVVQQRPI